jgi:hypothetical protein
MQLLKMPKVDATHVHSAPLIVDENFSVISEDLIQDHEWIPFPVKIVSSVLQVEMIFQASHIYRRILQHDVKKLATRNRLFQITSNRDGSRMGYTSLKFKPLDGEIRH